MGSLIRRGGAGTGGDLDLPYTRRIGDKNKPPKHLTRNLAALGGLCLVLFLFIRSSSITASLGISSPTRQKGPRGFTSAAAFEAAARHKQHLEEMAHRDTGDEGSLIVDTTTAAAAGGAHNLQPARTLDEHSLQGKNAPHFVGDQLVDAPDFDTAAAGGSQVGQAGSAAATNTAGSSFDKTHPHGVYSLTAVDIDGHERSLHEFAGKVTLFVNVASQCGYTDSNYKGLQKLYEKYKDSGLEILAFPSNQFGSQEPGSDPEIKQFAVGSYGATFPLFHKIDVNGPTTHEVYRYLKQELHIADPPGLKWNFQKVLVNRAGKPVLLIEQDWDQGRMEHAVYNLLVSAHGTAQ